MCRCKPGRNSSRSTRRNMRFVGEADCPRPIDRRALIDQLAARVAETFELENPFGVSADTVRGLEAQLDGARSGEVAALRGGLSTC